MITTNITNKNFKSIFKQILKKILYIINIINIKNRLKNYINNTSLTLISEIQKTQKSMANELQKIQSVVLNEQKLIHDEIAIISKDITQFSDIIHTIDNRTQQIHDAINLEYRKHFYFNTFEIETRQERGLCNITQEKNFTERFLLLIKNLSPQDIETIYLIIQRLAVLKTINKPIDIFSNEEKKQLDKVYHFKNSILKISENLFLYKNYFLPINHFEESVFLYRHGLEYIKNIDIIKEKDILDIGAFIGDSALILSEITDRDVYSFEATKENYTYLVETIKINNRKNIIPVHSAVGDNNDIINIRINGSASSYDEKMVKNPKHIEQCTTIKIDDFVKSNNISVGLIKVDIEGYEQKFIQGALETIKNQKPALILSIYHNTSDFLDIKPYIENLNLNYKFKIFKPVNGSVSGETILICEVHDQ